MWRHSVGTHGVPVRTKLILMLWMYIISREPNPPVAAPAISVYDVTNKWPTDGWGLVHETIPLLSVTRLPRGMYSLVSPAQLSSAILMQLEDGLVALFDTGAEFIPVSYCSMEVLQGS